MFKHTIAVSALALISIVPAAAQSTLVASQPPAVWTTPATMTTIGVCESQMRRLAGLNKTLAANYNAVRVNDSCAAGTSTNLASK
jgi:hypothetical protein